MSSPNSARLGALAALPLFLSSCIVVAKETDTKSAGPQPPPKSAPQVGGAAAPAKAAEGGDEAKARAAARKAEKRAFDLEIARTELELARMETENEERVARLKVDNARRSLEEARLALEHFKARLPRELESSQLGLDRATQGKIEAEQELREMEATYAKDQFATDTKELVLMRHRKRLEFAERGLRLSEAEFKDKREVELPRQQREHERKANDAEQSLRDAEFALERTRMSGQMQLARKRWAVTELERPLDEDTEKKGV